MPHRCRAVSTVADVTLALVLFIAAIGVLVIFVDVSEDTHEPIETEYTAETIAASTMNTSYSLAPAIRAHYRSHIDTSDGHPYAPEQLQRVSHGPIASHIADIVVTGAVFEGEQLSKAAVRYQQAVDQAFQTSLLESQFQTNVQAFWTPVKGVDIRGDVELGQTPPQYEDVSATTLTVPSGLPDVRAEAVDTVEADDEFYKVAEIVASAVIDGYLPEIESENALEGGGVEFDRTVYRYLRLATVIGEADPVRLETEGWLSPPTADAAMANAYLSEELADQLESQLQQTFNDAHQAAKSVSTGQVTITIRTWSND